MGGGGGGGGRNYTNTSAAIVDGEVIHHNTATNSWSYANSNSHSWTFDPAGVEWINQGTDARYEYNTRARSWTQVDKAAPLQSWQSVYDATDGWVWNDAHAGINWQYNSGSWKNVATSETYTASGAQLQDSGSNSWSYTPAAWTRTDAPEITSALFPLLPPNPAGQLGRIQQQGYILAATHLTTGAGYKTTYDEYQASFDAALELRGASRASAMSALKTPTSDLVTLINPWNTKYLQLANPHHTADHIFAPATTGNFDIWNRQGWRFAQTGKGAVLFKAKGTHKLTIGFSEFPSTEGDYKLVLQDTETTATLRDSGGDIARTTINTFATDGTSFYDYWLTYNNGIVTFGTGQYVGAETIYTFDLNTSGLTLADSTNKEKMQFISFSAESAAAYEFKDIRVLPHDTTIAHGGAYYINKRIPDEILIGGWQDDFDTYKDDLIVAANKTTISERSTAFQAISDGLAGPLSQVNATKTATDENGYATVGALSSSASRTDFDAVHTPKLQTHHPFLLHTKML